MPPEEKKSTHTNTHCWWIWIIIIKEFNFLVFHSSSFCSPCICTFIFSLLTDLRSPIFCGFIKNKGTTCKSQIRIKRVFGAINGLQIAVSVLVPILTWHKNGWGSKRSHRYGRMVVKQQNKSAPRQMKYYKWLKMLSQCFPLNKA